MSRVAAVCLLVAAAVGCAGQQAPPGVSPARALAQSGSRVPAKPYLNMPETAAGVLPPLLSETGAFADVRVLEPARGLLPYDLIVPFWSDGATKSRFVAIPKGKVSFSPTGEWAFPHGTVFVKTFELPVDAAQPQRTQRLETRLLVVDRSGGVYGVTYKWRADLEDAELLARASRRVFLDIDPGFGQMWRALGLCDVFRNHDAFVTVGTRIGQDDCRVPTCGLDWITTLPPVVIDQWPADVERGGSFTSVGAWRGPWAPVEYEGQRFGLRAHEFRRFAAVPRESGLDFEIALDIAPEDHADASRLIGGGWRLSDPRCVSGTPQEYQHYVRSSLAEFGIAKEMYVAARTGWVSDRTACYLASGRPAIVQNTGLDGTIETGVGLLTFSTPEEAMSAAHSVHGDWHRHARAARALAVEHFDSDRVLRRFVDEVAA